MTKPPKIVLNDLRSRGYQSVDWFEVHRGDDAQSWLGYISRIEDNQIFAVTVCSVTGRWCLEILNTYENFEIKDSTVLS